jgi:LmbE family N-acetylglucosaminyl deacetylase
MPALLFIGAHPDDETVYAGGTLAKYASEGVRVAVACATRGERGSTGGLCSIEELPQVREAELRRAVEILGAEEPYFLDYEDQKVAMADPAEIRRCLIRVIDAVRPDVVITFDPKGGGGHTDHVAVHRFATEAVGAASHRVERLVYTPPILTWCLAAEPQLSAQAGIDFVIDTSRWSRQKEMALDAHRTQSGLRRIFPRGSQDTLSVEAFTLASGPRPAIVPAGDLFD